MRYKHAVTALAITAGLALAGCSGDGDNTSTDPGTTQSEVAEQSFNAADVYFAQQMIPHHRQAIEMSDLAAVRAENPEVRQLAVDIAAAQGPEIQTMTGWLESWGEDVPPDTADGGMDHSVHGGAPIDDMPGMMTTEEMDQLEASTGTEFDQMFLTMMIAHHEGAIDMAATEQTDGENADAVALAEEVETDQAAEIAEMQALLSS